MTDVGGLEFETLIAEGLARVEAGGIDELDAFCREHADVATELRPRIEGLLEAGLITPGAPETIGPYKVLRPLGRGGMGEVYLAAQEHGVRRLVAVKRIRDVVGSEVILERFRIEQQALAMLEHPGIARIFEASVDGTGRPYFAMEFVAGAPIHRWCDEHRLTVRDRLELFAQVCEAVQHAHQKGLVHRDLKPANILVQDLDGRATVKIIDFGLAKATDVPLTERSLQTEAGGVLGTPEYMSPEQATEGGAKVDTRTDVYALGVVLYELLTGLLPFEPAELRRAGLLEMFRVLREVEAPTPSTRLSELGERLEEVAAQRGTRGVSLRASIRGDLDWITTKATEKDRDRRYASVSEFAADLRRHLAGEPVSAGPRTRLYWLRKFAARHPVGIGVAVVALLAGIVTTVVVTSLYLEAERNQWGFYRLDQTVEGRSFPARFDALYPALPRRIGAMEATIPEAETWLAATERVGVELAALRRDHPEELAGEPPRPAVARLYHGLETALVRLADLRTEVAPRLGSLRGRVEFARRIEADSIDAHRNAWSEAVRRAGDRHGVELEPQIGLVPLGPDPASTLEEFALLEPGVTIPSRDGVGRLVFGAGSRPLVFVLLPGGSSWMGAQASDPSLPNHDPEATGAESRLGDSTHPATRRDGSGWAAEDLLVRVDLDPFLISKFEVTQPQWERVMGENPSESFQESERYGLTEVLARLPVENVTLVEARVFAFRLGLELPTRAEWEYAARGGSGSARWWEDGLEGYRRFANVCDELCVQAISSRREHLIEINDGHAYLAPVGSFEANPHGLHDVLGNVWEYTEERLIEYAQAGQVGERGRLGPERNATLSWVIRGGSFISGSRSLRLSSQLQVAEDQRNRVFGLRPVFLLGRPAK